MRSLAPARSQSALHDCAQLGGSLNRMPPARIDDQFRNSPRRALLSIRIDDTREFLGALFVHQVVGAKGLTIVHSHVEWPVKPERKSTSRIVECVTAHPEVRQYCVGALEGRLLHDARPVAGSRPPPRD